MQHIRFPCPSLSPRVCSKSCPSRRWYHLPFHALPPPSPFAFNLSRHQSLFQWVGSLRQVAKVLELQRESFQWLWFIHYPQITCLWFEKVQNRDFPVAQWLRLHATTARGVGSTPDQGTKTPHRPHSVAERKKKDCFPDNPSFSA